MFRKAMLWFPALALGVLGLACRNPDAAVSKAGDQITGPQVTQTATGQDSKGAPVEKPVDRPAQVPTVAEATVSEAAVARPTDKIANGSKDQDASGTAGEKGALALTPAQAANATKGPEALRIPAKTPAGQVSPARVYTTAGMDTDKAVGGRPAGQVTRSGKGQEQGLALTPPTQGVPAAKGPEASRATAGTSAGQATQAQVPTAGAVNASKASIEGVTDQVARGDRNQGAAGTAGEIVEVAPLPPTVEVHPTKSSEASQATAEEPAEQATEARTTVPAEANANKAAVVEPTGQVAKNARGQSVPVTAVGRAEGPPTPLTQVANTTKGPEALRPISPADQAALARVATTDKDWSVRMAAVEGLTSQAVLARIATHDEDVDIRKLAVSLLTDQAALARVARSDKDWSVRWSAVTRLKDKAVLAQVAESDPDADIRKLAVSKLENRAATP